MTAESQEQLPELRSGSQARPTRLKSLAALIAVVASVLLLWVGWPSSSGPFYFDSEGYSRWLPDLRQASLTLDLLRDLIFENPFPGGRARPLSNLTFIVESSLTGFRPDIARLVNIILHGLNIGLVFLLQIRVLELLGFSNSKQLFAASFGTLLWGFNPYHADAVLYAVQRMTLLSTFFYLVGCLFFLATRRSRSPLAWAGVLVCFIGAVASKETGLLFPLGLALLAWLVPCGCGTGKQRRVRDFAPILVLAAATALASLLMRPDLLTSPARLLYSGERQFTWLERLMTEGRVLVNYLSALFLPHPDRLAFVLKFKLSTSLINPWTTVIAWTLIIAFIWAAVRWHRSRPILALAILWYFSNHLLESTILPLEIAFVHRNYLPSVFLFLPLTVWATSWDTPGRRRFAVALLSLLLVLLLMGWHSRATIWGEPIAFWKDAVNKSPGSLRAHINLGVAYDIEGDPERALEVYERGASSAFEEDSKAWSSLYCCMGIAYGNLAKIPEARRYMELSANTVPLADCLLNLANLQLVQLDLSNAEQTLNQLEKMSPRHAKLRLLRAKLFLATGRIELARSELTEELRLHPETEEARQMLSDLDQH